MLSFNAPKSNLWCEDHKSSSRALLRIFCFPYAGGSASIFREWPSYFPGSVEVCAVQLPGRGARLSESCLSEITSMASAALDGLLHLIDRPFVVFGHSMGALLAFEFSRLLASRHGIKPEYLFVSACKAPQLRDRQSELHSNLPEPEFIQYVRELNGTPPEVLQHPELLQLLLPVLRGDFAACETYSYVPGPMIGCPISAFGGIRDADVARDLLEGWKEHAPQGAFSLSLLPGNHFFLHQSMPVLVNRLLLVLAPLLHRLQFTPRAPASIE